MRTTTTSDSAAAGMPTATRQQMALTVSRRWTAATVRRGNETIASRQATALRAEALAGRAAALNATKIAAPLRERKGRPPHCSTN